MKFVDWRPVTEIEFASFTGSYQEAISETHPIRILLIFNDLDQTIMLSFDGGTTTHFKLKANQSFALDFGASMIYLNASSICYKHAGIAPTDGSIIFSYAF